MLYYALIFLCVAVITLRPIGIRGDRVCRSLGSPGSCSSYFSSCSL